jgi:hypothetical protein
MTNMSAATMSGQATCAGSARKEDGAERSASADG